MGESPVRGDPADDADDADAADAARVSRINGGGADAGQPLLFRRLSPRQKALRALVVVVPVLVIVALVSGVPTALSAWIATWGQSASSHSTTVATFPASVASVSLPKDVVSQQQLSVAALGDQGWLIICWMKLAQVDGRQVLQPEVAVTYDGGVGWQEMPIPNVPGALNCSLVAGEVEPYVLAVIGHLNTQGGGCVEPELEVLDVGALQWQAVPWPTAACQNTFANSGFPATGPTLALVGTTVYAWNATGLLSRDDSNHAGRILETDDRDHSWRALDASFDPTALVSLVGVQQGGQLLAETRSADGTTDTLWQSSDDGNHWENRGKLPGANARVSVATDAGEDGSGNWGRLYVSYDTLPGSVPAPTGPFLGTSTLGQVWHPVLLPPSVSLSVSPAALPTGTPIITSLVVGPDDTLILTNYRPQGTGQPITSQPQNIWQWDPTSNGWTLANKAIAANAYLAAMSWSEGTLTYWVVVPTEHGANQTFTLQRILLG